MFKVGDKVKCIRNNSNYTFVLDLNKEYTVETITGTLLVLVEVPLYYHSATRFTYASSTTTPSFNCPFKVGDVLVCLLDKAFNANVSKGDLVTVTGVSPPNNPNCWWLSYEDSNNPGESYYAYNTAHAFDYPDKIPTITDYVMASQVQSTNKQACRCQMRDLLMQGCKCGGV